MLYIYKLTSKGLYPEVTLQGLPVFKVHGDNPKIEYSSFNL